LLYSIVTQPKNNSVSHLLHYYTISVYISSQKILVSAGTQPKQISFPNLLSIANSGNFLHGGATGSLLDLVGSAVFYTTVAQTRGLPLGINVSYLDAAFSNVEIDIGAKVRAVKAVGVATAELKKKSGRIIAQARYSKYIGASSRLKATLPCKL
ncbi:acyl-coenzyme A thioesterase 13, partial [Triticum aestivum]|uniref:acyl-coenzyme A thioesterase 13 n=1 Tax=Triticum aestivum TaxID=4565 RepID=UPI001D010515